MSDFETISYPVPVEQVVATLADVFRRKNDSATAELLVHAIPEIEYIGEQDFGLYAWDLRLTVSPELYDLNERSRSQTESNIRDYLHVINDHNEDNVITRVKILRDLTGGTVAKPKPLPTEAETSRIWKGQGTIKLFISHLAKHKTEVHALKAELAKLGIISFVAHDDIQPSKQWQEEIKLALASMDALVALVTSEFIESEWCDHEVGWALGRGVTVLPVRLKGAKLHGFLGGIQAISGALNNPATLAKSIYQVLIKTPETGEKALIQIARGLLTSEEFTVSNGIATKLRQHPSFPKNSPQSLPQSVKDVIQRAFEENFQVQEAWDIQSLLREIMPEQYDGSDKGQRDDGIPF